MRTDRARPGRPSDADPSPRDNWRSRWRVWLPFVVKPLRRGIVIFVLLLVIEYLVVPELVGASRDLYLLGQVNPAWLVAGVVLEGASLFCYGLLTQAVLPAGAHNPGLSRLFRIDLAAAAVAHVIPAGTLGSAGIGYRLFTAEGIKGRDAGVMMATKGLGSTVVLNVLLWLSLVISIPLAGFHPIYVTVAVIGAVVLLAIGILVFGITRQSERASRILRAIGNRIPGLTGDRLEQAVSDAGNSLSALARDRRTLAMSLTWASLNWLLDAASLWCFVAAFGRLVNPVELFAAYGIANVAGALPVTPAGLGVIDSVTPLLLVSFGITRSVATLGVLGWRLVNFWLPIPAGAAAYISLKVPRGSGLKAMRAAVATLMSRPGATDVAARDAGAGPGAEKPRIVRPNDRDQAAASQPPTADQRDRPGSPGGLIDARGQRGHQSLGDAVGGEVDQRLLGVVGHLQHGVLEVDVSQRRVVQLFGAPTQREHVVPRPPVPHFGAAVVQLVDEAAEVGIARTPRGGGAEPGEHRGRLLLPVHVDLPRGWLGEHPAQ